MVERLKKALGQYWGYTEFRPLQQEAMQCLCQGRDAVVVLPTGGGKSLCFQAPAVTASGMAVVVSPLISLMKDQVDALTECGVPAARIDSSLTPDERDTALDRVRKRQLKLLYISPERLVSDGFSKFLQTLDLSFIAIDEAHCISMWGHDFRPEYRQLGSLRQIFPKVAIGAYTATATEQVRRDIAEQLRLQDPTMLVGSFDRPNLIYKVRPRSGVVKQVCEVLDRYKDESGIIYCIRRKDVEQMAEKLTAKGYRVAPYHAGMTDEARKQNQDDFVAEKIDTIIATVAFGMGIDKSNVRYVIHTGMPKSLEHYQQESGRAGRDGLEAECWLFYSGGDYGIWKSILTDSRGAGVEPAIQGQQEQGQDALATSEAQDIGLAKLARMYSYCTDAACRRRTILQYFGQAYKQDNCGTCDICLGDVDLVDDALITAQKILSCILRLGQRFGGGYTALVLTGSRDQRILDNRHDALSTYGLLKDYDQRTVHDWIEQLAGQGFIEKTGEYNVLSVTEKGWRVIREELTPRLLKPVEKAQKPERKAKVAAESWEGVDKGLFEALRRLRTSLASERHVPAYIIFGDAALRDMARRRPSTLQRFLNVRGVGETKCEQYGRIMVEKIRAYCLDHALELDR
ncbi:MAG: DNA helicase RecQ [Planctomycetes bacterium]|nr:DNA helicase RecQ [Planctomycetota bacterium]